MKATLWTVRTEGGGQVSITPRPRPDEWLDLDLRLLRESGVDDLVSALTGPEADELGLGAEQATAGGAGLGFHRLPITDMHVPGDTRAFLAMLGPVADRVRDGRHVAVHCRASIGRSGIIASLLLTLNGWDPQDAMTHLSALRDRTVPETADQRAWVLAAAETAERKAPSLPASFPSSLPPGFLIP